MTDYNVPWAERNAGRKTRSEQVDEYIAEYGVDLMPYCAYCRCILLEEEVSAPCPQCGREA